MKFTPLDIKDVMLVEPQVFSDERGFFFESYSDAKFSEGVGYPVRFVQDNHSTSKKGVLRGLHFQRPPHAQGKLVRVVAGAAFDVAVDIRPQSATFGQWIGVTLTGENKRQLWIPPGFAHGFLSLEDGTEFLYKATALYDKSSEGAVRWDDPSIGIDWPARDVLVAAKDAGAPLLVDAHFE